MSNTKAITITILFIICLMALISLSPKSPVIHNPISSGTNTNMGNNNTYPSYPDSNNGNTVPSLITIHGTWECLPHRDTSGPQTMECAFGIKENTTGKHYALDLNSIPDQMPNFSTDTQLLISGVLVPENKLNAGSWQKYPISGIIAVESIQMI